MASRDEQTDSSRTGRPNRPADLPLPEPIDDLMDWAEEDKRAGRQSVGTRGAADQAVWNPEAGY
jgi:hypothetical protein